MSVRDLQEAELVTCSLLVRLISWHPITSMKEKTQLDGFPLPPFDKGHLPLAPSLLNSAKLSNPRTAHTAGTST